MAETLAPGGADCPRTPDFHPLLPADLYAYNRILDDRLRIQVMPPHVIKKLQEEISVLERELNHELPKELKRARALGDLSENAEFIMAKQRQDYVGARLAQLKKRLADLSLINFNNIPKGRIAFGSRVVLYDIDRDSEVEYRLVTSEEADVGKGLISTTSPIGRGLMGKQVGDTVKIATPNGTRELEVRALQTIYDEA
ncbi:MAG TPA: transcription elongation factor GreA [Terriglobia bacterium]|nr:transcription elongation factor GreA [Terriglobia bacterium]